MGGGLGVVERKSGTKPIYGRYTMEETPDDLKDLAKQDRLFNESLSPATRTSIKGRRAQSI
jgi:hypothetical protein